VYTLVGCQSVWVLSPDRCSCQPKTCDCWHTGEDSMSEEVAGTWAVTCLCIHLTPEDKSRKNLSQGITALPSWKVLGTIHCATASAGLLILMTLGLRIKWPGSTHQRRYLQSCRTKGFPTISKVWVNIRG